MGTAPFQSQRAWSGSVFGPLADITVRPRHVRFTPERVAKRGLNRPPNRDSVVDAGSEAGSGHDGAARARPASQGGLADRSAGGVGREEGCEPFFAYDANYLIDNKVGIILDAGSSKQQADNDCRSGNEPASRSPLLIDFLPLVLMWRTLSSVLICQFPAS